ncbi:MAG TPA: chemotaxis protein CheA [Marinagarivorans sp.]
MSFGEDEEILQDFLVEAGEILDQLSEQLVELEQRPDDRDLLNAIFRGFHTVKGGAGFLQLNNMVTCCHVTENLFDILRNGKRPVTSELMDVVLQALDTVNSQFEDVQQRRPPQEPSVELVNHLERLVSCEDLNEATAAPAEDNTVQGAELFEPPQAPADAKADDGTLNLSDDEYQGYIDAIADSPADSGSNESTAATAGDSEEISEDEFENLLDQLHGKGGGPGAKAPSAADPATPANKLDAAQQNNHKSAPAASASPGNQSDEISEDEFEALLDQLHGSGKGPTVKADAPSPSPPTKAPSQGAGSDLITDSEFEDLLDQLHGAGKGPATEAKTPAATAQTQKPRSEDAPQSTPGKKPEPESQKASDQGAGQAAANHSANVTAISAAKSNTPSAAPASAAVPKAREPAATMAAAVGGGGGGAAPAAEATVRVDTQRLDDIMNMVGELVLVRNRLVRLGLDANDESLSKAVSNLDVVTADLQTAVMKTRMQPIKKVFGRFPRVVRDLARNLKKEITLELVGEETDLDKNLVEALADPLVHLVRNSVDHGIELPADREEKGKSRVGKVILAAEQEGDHILLSITDDGGGMDPNKLREKAVEKGVLDPDAAARISDVEAFNLIFAPGFSTKSEISDVSGRGVGMDVVKTKITQLNGSIDIDSKLGEGTRIAIKVPLTLAIMPTLMIMLGKQTFALPLVSVNEIFHMDLRKTNVVDGQECVTIRAKAIPIFHLKRWLVKGPVSVDKPEEGHVVIVNVGTRRVGFIVDQLIGQEEVVIKPLGKMLQGTPGMAGATITGDGTIALILDVPSMLNKYVGTM